MRTFLLVVVVLILLAGALWTGFLFNVSARVPHWAAVREAIEIVRDRSIVAHSGSVTIPPLDDPKYVREGGSGYEAMCRACHGAPGFAAEVFAKGLYPWPADLLSGGVQKEWKDNQLFWIVDNGLKMTGMPAFGATHDREDLLGIVAFLKRLPGMSTEEYQLLTNGSHQERAAQDGRKQAPTSMQQ